jgi:predicted N-acetyltransferase YhbS
MSGVNGQVAIEVVSNGELRAGGNARVVANLSAEKRSTLLANPLLGGDDEPVRLFALVDSRQVGGIDLIAGELETPNGSQRVFWGSALWVGPESRGKGLGRTLLRHAESFGEVAAACAPSRMSLPLYRQFGYVDLELRRHVLVKRLRPLVEPRLGATAGGAIASVGELALRAQHALFGVAGGAHAGALEATPATAFPPELEPQLAVERAPYAPHRSAAWLDWIVRESFYGVDHRRELRLVQSAGGDVLGYLLVKARRYSGVTRWQVENLYLGSLVDWQVFEPRALSFEQLVRLAVEALDGWGVDAIEVCLPPEERARLLRLGFVPAGAQHVVCRGQGQDLPSDPAAWTLRPGEGDHAFS